MSTLAFLTNDQLIEFSKSAPWFIVSTGLAYAIWRVAKWVGGKGNSVYDLLFNHEHGKFIEMVDSQKDFVKSVKENNVAVREDILITLESIRNIERKLDNLSKIGFENLNSDYFNVLFEHSPLPIAFINSEQNFMTGNTKFIELLGYTNNELRTMYIKDVTKDTDINLETTQTMQMIDGDIDYFRLEKTLLRKNDTEIYCTVYMYRIPTEGPFDHFIKVIIPRSHCQL